MKLIDRLYEQSRKNMAVCLGLDTKEAFLPDYLAARDDLSTGEKFFEFNRKIIDATCDIVACYKVQIACYEAYGLDGLAAYSKTLKYIRQKGQIVIADVKRGDISSTAAMYADGHFSGDFEADFITVNSYMGLDAVSPYFDYMKNNDKGLFLLVKTSNPNGYQIQDLMTEEGLKVYEKMGEYVQSWGSEFIGESGYSAIGAVVGLTYPKEFKHVRKYMKNVFFLIPGYGAQGGTGKDIAEIFSEDICGVVNSSRGIISAHKGIKEDESFVECTVDAVRKMQKDIGQCL